jgi:hypothetical protein
MLSHPRSEELVFFLFLSISNNAHLHAVRCDSQPNGLRGRGVVRIPSHVQHPLAMALGTRLSASDTFATVATTVFRAATPLGMNKEHTDDIVAARPSHESEQARWAARTAYLDADRLVLLISRTGSVE